MLFINDKLSKHLVPKIFAGSEVSSTWKFSHSSGMSTGRFEHFEKNNVISMERERADGGNNSFMTVENDKEEDYYYTTPVSQRQNQPNINQHQNLETKIKTRSMGPEGRSASSSPKTILQQNSQNFQRMKLDNSSRYAAYSRII